MKKNEIIARVTKAVNTATIKVKKHSCKCCDGV